MKKALILFFLTFSCSKDSSDKNGCSKENALKLAENAWLKAYGKSLFDLKPFTSKLKSDSIWVVEGSLPKNYDGGVPYPEINLKNCKILKISHGK